jgi:hypothetical protein
MFRYSLVLLIVIKNMFQITTKDYIIMSNITMISIIGILSWPNDIKEITFYQLYILQGYSLSITYNYVGLYISLVLDILIWISIIYESRFIQIVKRSLFILYN